MLGLASVVRPTSVAAVYAFLAARSPTPLLLAYVLAGLALSLSVGVAAVAIVHVTPPPPSVTTTGRDIADIVLGVLALGSAGYYGLRTPPDTPAVERPARTPSRLRRRLSQPTVSSAALAGVATHLPGVFYLGALAAIVASRPGLVGGLLQVGFYNLLWYAVPLAALASWTLRPGDDPRHRRTAHRLGPGPQEGPDRRGVRGRRGVPARGRGRRPRHEVGARLPASSLILSA